MQGWISVHRKIQSHWLWEDKPFSKGQAWIDILLLANHEDKKTLMDGQLIEVKRGECITSEPKLAERWGWSRTKVRNFLEMLEQDEMIKNIKEGRKRTRLKVLHYNEYQDSENKRKTTEEQEKNKPETTEEQVKDINNNDNNGNNVNKEYMRKIELFNQWWNLYNKKVDRKKCETKFLKILEKHSFEEIVEGTKRYLDYLKATNTDKQYQKHPLTFLNGENWKDEYEEHQKQKQSQNRPIFKREPDYD